MKKVTVDLDTLTADEAADLMNYELARLSSIETAAFFSRGNAKRQLSNQAKECSGNLFILADVAHGEIPAEVANMSDDELLAELLG